MSIVLDLPPELESELAEEAARLNLPLSEYASRRWVSGRSSEPKPSTGAELVTYWINAGLVGTRPEIADSVEHARELRKQAETRVSP